MEEGMRANRAFRMREGCLKEFAREELALDSPVFRDMDSFIAAKTQRLGVED